jgi:hypothetical protein
MTFPPAAVPAPEPVATKKKGLSRPAIIGIVAGALVLLLGLGAAAWALVQVVLGTGQSASESAKVFPQNTVYWTEFALEPSNAQRLEAYRFFTAIDALEDAMDELDIDLDELKEDGDFKKSLWSFLVDGDESEIDTDLDYDDDIKPWLGNRLAIGLVGEGDFDEDNPPLVVAIEARDTKAGIEAVEQFIDDVDGDAKVGERDGYVIVTLSDLDIDDLYDDGTLNESEGFRAVADSAGDWGVTSIFADLGALYSMIGEASLIAGYDDVDYWRDDILDNYYSYVDYSAYEDYEDCTPFDSPDNVGDETYEDYECDYYYAYNGEYYRFFDDFARAYVEENLDELARQKAEEYEAYTESLEKVIENLEGTTAFMVSRFVNGAFELDGVVAGLKELPKVTRFDRQGALPESAMLVLSLADFGIQLDEALADENLAALGSAEALAPGAVTGITRDEIEDWFDETLGLDFPESLDSLFGSNIEIVIDSDFDLDSLDASSVGDTLGDGAAIVVTSDSADATVDAWETLIDSLEDAAGEKLDVDVEKKGNRVVISGGGYLDDVLDVKKALSDTDGFRRAVPNAKGASAVLYLDVEALVELIDDVSGMGISDYTDGLQAIGMSQTPLSDSSYRFTLRVTSDAD